MNPARIRDVAAALATLCAANDGHLIAAEETFLARLRQYLPPELADLGDRALAGMIYHAREHLRDEYGVAAWRLTRTHDGVPRLAVSVRPPRPAP